MALGLAQAQDRFDSPRELLGERLREGSIYRLLADEGARIFPDDYFADLYSASARGRPTVPARVLATAMVLQAFEGLSDREACDRLEVDLRWQAAAGCTPGPRPSTRRCSPASATACGPLGVPGACSRTPKWRPSKPARWATGYACSTRPRCMTLSPPRTPSPSCGRPSGSCWWCSTTCTRRWQPQCEARSARRRLPGPGKPPCDWDDRSAREALVDDLVHDARSALAALDGAELSPLARDAADLLALVAGQDVGQGDDGRFRIAKKVAKDRVISTVDTEARHGHKSANRHFDGYKAHICIDPELRADRRGHRQRCQCPRCRRRRRLARRPRR